MLIRRKKRGSEERNWEKIKKRTHIGNLPLVAFFHMPKQNFCNSRKDNSIFQSFLEIFDIKTFLFWESTSRKTKENRREMRKGKKEGGGSAKKYRARR